MLTCRVVGDTWNDVCQTLVQILTHEKTVHTLASPCLCNCCPLALYCYIMIACLAHRSLPPRSVYLPICHNTEDRKNESLFLFPGSLRGMEGIWELPKLLRIWWISGYFRLSPGCSPREGRAEWKRAAEQGPSHSPWSEQTQAPEALSWELWRPFDRGYGMSVL